MSTDVVMPQMGESIAEGTVVRWIKKVGDKVDRDEPLFEISTDKVDAEIPSPAAGVVSEIRVKEGETVPVNSVVAVIGAAGGTQARARRRRHRQTPEPRRRRSLAPGRWPQLARQRRRAAPPHERSALSARCPPAHRPKPGVPVVAGPPEEAIRERSSPLVRKIAKEHQVDLAQIHGTGIAGRVTKDDILGYIAGTAHGREAARTAGGKPAGRPAGRVSGAPRRRSSPAPPIASRRCR